MPNNSGNFTPDTGARQSRTDILAFADSFRGQHTDVRPGTVAMATMWGMTRPVGDRSGVGGYIHPVVRDILGRIPIPARSLTHEKCGDLYAVSYLLLIAEARTGTSITSVTQARLALDGAILQTAIVRTPQARSEHGAPLDPCSSCQRVLDALGVRYR